MDRLQGPWRSASDPDDGDAGGGARALRSGPGLRVRRVDDHEPRRAALPLRLRRLHGRERALRHARLPRPAHRASAARASGCGSTASWRRPVEARPAAAAATATASWPCASTCRASSTSTRTRPTGSSAATSWAGGRTWRRPSTASRLAFGALMDERSILLLDGGALRGRDRRSPPLILALGVYAVLRRGRPRPRRGENGGAGAPSGIIRARHEHQARLRLPSPRTPVDLLVVVLDAEKTLHEIDDPASPRTVRGPRPAFRDKTLKREYFATLPEGGPAEGPGRLLEPAASRAATSGRT